MDRSDVEAWVDRYVRAWGSNAPDDIGDLFTEDARYYTAPYRPPWAGRDAIVREWLGRKDEPGDWGFRYEVLGVDGDLGFVRGWTTYHTEESDYSNLWVIRLEPDGRCSEFIEWWVDASAEEVATSFIEAYGAFDVEQATSYLAEDADISGLMTSVGAQSVEGTLEEFRLLISFLEAQGYEQMLSFCEELGSSASGTTLRCTFDYHAIRSDEIGLGPFSGSNFVITVREGKVVRAVKTLAVEEFSPQMWEPFASWVSTKYPEDAAVMYEDESYSGARLTEESIRLWEQHSRRYVKEVRRGTAGAETSQ